MTDKRRIVVVGLDGATWDVLRPRMEDGRLPNLKRLADAGATGDLESIYPPETPAAWPSFMTGKNPGKHGVFDFLVYDPESKTEHPVNAGLRVGKTLWEYLDEAGMTSLVLNVPTTYPPAPIRGAVITDFLTPAHARDYAHPRELVDELERDYGKYPLFFESMQFVPSSTDHNATIFLNELERMDRIKFEVAEKLFDRHDPDFTMVHIWGTDRLQHELWTFLDPGHPHYQKDMAEKFGPRIEAYYRMIDERIGRLADKAGPQGIVVVMSDHGFGPTHHFIDLNSWLLREGFIVLKDTAAVRAKKALWDLGITPGNVTRLVLPPLFRFGSWLKAPAAESVLRKSTGAIGIPGMLSLHDIDWSRTKAYAPFGWSGIYINTRGIRPHGSVDPEDYDAVRDEVVARWRQLRNGRTGELVGGPVHTNGEMFHGPFSPYGPDVMPLPLAQKYLPVCFFGFTSKEPVYENWTLFGNHRMEGVLLASGKGVRSGPVSGANLMDLAPTFLYLLGQAVPDDMDGRVLESLIDPAELEARPVAMRHVEAGPDATRDGLSEAEQAEIRDKLAGLGYL